MNLFLKLSGTKLAALIRKGAASSEEVVRIHIEHIKKVNPRINAVVRDRFAAALQEAQAVDRRLATGEKDLPPFAGVPCTTKESFAFAGMPQTSGLVSRRHMISDCDATAVARMKKAGFIPLGVSNIPELCLWIETNNRIYGRTNNPYNPKRIVGGSSGGEGAIIGAGGSPLGLGSDVAGSIRLPAFFNGIFGHKPTGGMVPATGHYPTAENEAKVYLCCGPLARCAEDLMPLLKILAGPDGEDSACCEIPLENPELVNPKDLTVLNVQDNGYLKVSRDLRVAQEKCARALALAGATVKPMKIGKLKRSMDIWGSMISSAEQSTTFRQMLGNGRSINLPWEFLRWALRRSPHTLPALTLVVLEHFFKLTPRRAQKFVALGWELRQEMEELIGAQGIMLYPSFPRPAPVHLHPLLTPFDWVYTGIINVMEFPASQIPLGLNARGLPLGVQVIALPGNDHLTIATAMAMEKAFGGWVPPSVK